jgi:hypothetical protein
LPGAAWLCLILLRPGRTSSPHPSRALTGQTLDSLCFILLAASAGLGLLWDQFSPLLAIGSLAAALCAWDLARFELRLRELGETSAPPEVEKRHLRRLLFTAGAGAGLAWVPFGVHLSLQFVPLLVIALFAALAVRQVILFLRHDE